MLFHPNLITCPQLLSINSRSSPPNQLMLPAGLPAVAANAAASQFGNVLSTYSTPTHTAVFNQALYYLQASLPLQPTLLHPSFGMRPQLFNTQTHTALLQTSLLFAGQPAVAANAAASQFRNVPPNCSTHKLTQLLPLTNLCYPQASLQLQPTLLHHSLVMCPPLLDLVCPS